LKKPFSEKKKINGKNCKENVKKRLTKKVLLRYFVFVVVFVLFQFFLTKRFRPAETVKSIRMSLWVA